ncbi:MAG: hypothetical protein ACO1NZ_03960 [Adhaeribacter sp.]
MVTGAAPDIRSRLHDRLDSILKAFTRVQLLGAGGVLLGLGLKLSDSPGQQAVFVFSLALLAFLFVLQVGISFSYVYMHLALAFLGGFSSLSLALAFITLMFKYQHWWGSYILVVLTVPILLLSVGLLTWYFSTGEFRHHAHRRFLYYNIVAPFFFVTFLWLFYLLLHDHLITPDMKHHRQSQDQSSLLWPE